MTRPLRKLTKRTQAAYCEAIEIGAILESAAAYAGVHPETVRQWLTRGVEAAARQQNGEEIDADDARCIDFEEAVARARGVAGMTWQQVVSEAAMTDPSWAWKMLQVRFPEEYRQSNPVEISGPQGAALAITLVIDK